MTRSIRSHLVAGLLLGLAVVASPAMARTSGTEFQALEGEAGLARAATPDTTARQRYASAVREAYGARKNNLAECATHAAAERKACQAQAHSLFKQDMAAANALRR